MPQYSEAAVAAKVRRAVLAFTTLVVTDKMLRAPLTSPFSTKHNDPVSPLLRLPAELRNQIYEYALTSTEPLAFSWKKSPLEKKKRRNGIQLSSGAPPGLALLFVCRKTHYETVLLPFVFNTVQCRSLAVLERLRNRLSPDQRRAITKLRLITHFYQEFNFLRMVYENQLTFSAILPEVRRVVVQMDRGTYHYNVSSTPETMMAYLEGWLQGKDKKKVLVEFEESSNGS
jgi:hypothetical protein